MFTATRRNHIIFQFFKNFREGVKYSLNCFSWPGDCKKYHFHASSLLIFFQNLSVYFTKSPFLPIFSTKTLMLPPIVRDTRAIRWEVGFFFKFPSSRWRSWSFSIWPPSGLWCGRTFSTCPLLLTDKKLQHALPHTDWL